jgi:hypothetical protein
LVTVVAFGGAVVITCLVACGVSGCGGGGFGPSYAPLQAQLGLLVAGFSLVPLALVLLRGRPRRYQAAGAVGALAVGVVVAMVTLGLGPNGCPWGHSRSLAGTGAFAPGSLTCIPDSGPMRSN